MRHGRVYRRPNGRYEVVWQTHRHFATEEEAREAASGPPPPPKGHPRVSDEIAQLALRAKHGGIPWRVTAAMLTLTGVPTPTGKSSWDGGTLRKAAQRWRDQRDAADARARHGEWNLEHADVLEDESA